MQYWEIVTRSFRVSWRHKYLWLIALFSGEAGGGFSGSYNGSMPTTGNKNGSPPTPDFNGAVNSAGNWLNQHVGLIVVVVALVILIWIAFFVLAAICEGATVRASAEHDAERPFGLGLAWRCGLDTMGKVIRIRLLIFALLLPAGILLLGLTVGFIVSILSHSVGAAVAFGAFGALALLAAIPYVIYVGFLDRLGTRAVVLEVLGARAALARGHRLVTKRLGRVLLVWLLSIAIGIAVAVVLAIAIIVVAVPLIVGVIIVAATGSPFAVILIIVGVVIFLPVAFTLSGFASAQSSTYWTLAFRRLEIDQPPPAAYPNVYAQPLQGLPPV